MRLSAVAGIIRQEPLNAMRDVREGLLSGAAQTITQAGINLMLDNKKYFSEAISGFLKSYQTQGNMTLDSLTEAAKGMAGEAFSRLAIAEKSNPRKKKFSRTISGLSKLSRPWRVSRAAYHQCKTSDEAVRGDR